MNTVIFRIGEISASDEVVWHDVEIEWTFDVGMCLSKLYIDNANFMLAQIRKIRDINI